ncbi:ABC transporter substrate-binding protein [Burkholderia sp. Bp9090]|uniref:ABC transporter substrate-binding protein n=1 Tax=Burkholderia sp. Bp9090 TaxID=2184567 RepID=UPI000F600499|nr:ABC transporter substrate-binding protein [Burkholderia sp. Bp9090]RQZ27021.1 ABC transporter substrate-binding protein [Burkholderia sp. Bp9090]
METTPVRVMWFVPPLLALVAGGEPGAIRVDARRNRSSDEQFDALVSGEVDAVVTSMDNVIGWNRRAGPRDFRVVAQIERTTPLSVVGQASRATLDDLRDTDILVDAVDNGFVVALRMLLRDAGLMDDEYGLVPCGGVKERLDALVAGQGAATLLGPPFDAMAVRAGLTSISSVQQIYPAFPGQGVVMRTGCAARASVAAWLADLERARLVVAANAERAERAVIAAGLPPAAGNAMLATTPVSLSPDRAGIALLIAHRRALGLVGGDDDHAAVVDDSLVEGWVGEDQ